MLTSEKPLCFFVQLGGYQTHGEFPGRLLSKDSQATMPGGGRSFRSRTAEFWEVWPMPECVDEVHRVVFVDGIYLARDLVVLIARLRRCGRKPWSSAAFGMLSPR